MRDELIIPPREINIIADEIKDEELKAFVEFDFSSNIKELKFPRLEKIAEKIVTISRLTVLPAKIRMNFSFELCIRILIIKLIINENENIINTEFIPEEIIGKAINLATKTIKKRIPKNKSPLIPPIAQIQQMKKTIANQVTLLLL